MITEDISVLLRLRRIVTFLNLRPL